MEDALEEMDDWQMCRICGGNNCDLVPIYDDSGISLQLEEKINHYLPITVTQEDELPLLTCIPCIEKLNITHELIVACLEADDKLKELLQLKKKSIEINDHKQPKLKQLKVLVQEKDGVMLIKESSENEVLNSHEEIDSQECCIESRIELEQSLETDTSCEGGALDLGQENLVMFSSLKQEENLVKEEKANFKNLQELGISEEENEEQNETPDLSYYVPSVDSLEQDKVRDDSKDSKCEGEVKEEPRTILLMNGDSLGFDEEAKESSSITNQCKYCRKKFDSKALKSHLQSCVCEYCGTHFACPGTLQAHKLQHLKQIYKCKFPNCNKKFQDYKKLSAHFALHSSDQPWLCDFCGKRFLHSNSLRTHYRTHQQTHRDHKCNICGKAFRARFILRNHMMSHTGERPFLCERCPKRFSTKEALKQHSAVHDNARPFKCSLCSFSCIRRGNLAKHYETHSDTKFECKLCHEAFSSRLLLQNHHHTHSEAELKSINELEGPSMAVCTSYRCEQCGKFLSSKASLTIHQRMHSGDRPYVCPQCGKRFSQKPSLDYHVRLHTGERPHLCAFCGQGFNSKAAKDSHERVHTGEKPYRCSVCSARFRNCANLRQHQLIHNDTREHPCSVCGKRFRRREAVQVHMRVHTGERPYSCPLCLKKFTQKGDQLKHTRGHIMKNDKKCSFCGQEFPNRRELKQHKCELKVINDNQHFETVLLNPTELIANTEITVVTADIPEMKDNYQETV